MEGSSGERRDLLNQVILELPAVLCKRLWPLLLFNSCFVGLLLDEHSVILANDVTVWIDFGRQSYGGRCPSESNSNNLV